MRRLSAIFVLSFALAGSVRADNSTVAAAARSQIGVTVGCHNLRFEPH